MRLRSFIGWGDINFLSPKRDKTDNSYLFFQCSGLVTLKTKFKTGFLNGYGQSYSIQDSAHNFLSEKGEIKYLNKKTVHVKVIRPCTKM